MADLILAFETSCDDTSVAIVDTDYNVHANIISSQPDHIAFGGVLPELASRLHLKNINKCLTAALKSANKHRSPTTEPRTPTTDITLNDISAIAVSANPGLIGSLLVGVSFAKALAWSLDIPLIAVNHMLGHIMANKIENPDLQPPYLTLVVSGGHTELVIFENDDFTLIGQTLDDAAGECFDKVAKLLGLGFPGGPIIDKVAKTGDPHRFHFPRALNKKDNYHFSFSGLKTAVLTWTQKQTPEFIQDNLPDIVASVQQAIVDILVKKTISAAQKYHLKTIIIAGGVSANSVLRAEMKRQCDLHNMTLYHPKLEYCMDNAAMIGIAAITKYQDKEFAPLSLNAFSTKGLRKIR